MNQELQLLEEQENNLRQQIQHNESTLSSILEENNSLEAEYLSQTYQHIHKDRPTQVRNIFAEIEKDFLESDLMMSEDFLLSSIESYNQQSLSLKAEVNQIYQAVNQQRNELHRTIQQINEVRQANPIYAKKLSETCKLDSSTENCSRNIETRARQLAYSIDDVDEDELIQYLARGPADQSEGQILEQTRNLCERQYVLNQSIVSNEVLSKLNDKIRDLCSSEHKKSSQKAADEVTLSNAFELAANNLSTISSNFENRQNGNNSDDDEEYIAAQWKQLQKISDDINVVRAQLLDTVKSDQTIPLPQEFSHPEREREALQRTLEALAESNRLMTDYLQKLANQGIVDSRIIPPEEVKSIVARFNELKQKQH